MTRALLKAATFAALTAVCAAGAHATVLFELDFQAPASGSIVTATTSVATDQLTLINNATVNPTGAAVTASHNPKLQSGYLDIPRTGNSDNSSLITLDTADGAPTNYLWRDFVGSATFGSGTMAVVYKPNFDGPQTGGSSNGRFHFVQSHTGSNTDAWTLYNQDGTGNLTFRAGRPGTNFIEIGIPTFNWDSDTWYLMVASWSVGSPLRLFVAELQPKGMIYTVESAENLIDGAGFARPIIIGSSSSFNGDPTGENANGQFAYFLWTDEYSSERDFMTLLSTMVPEPSSLSVIAGALAWSLRRPGRKLRTFL